MAVAVAVTVVANGKRRQCCWGYDDKKQMEKREEQQVYVSYAVYA